MTVRLAVDCMGGDHGPARQTGDLAAMQRKLQLDEDVASSAGARHIGDDDMADEVIEMLPRLVMAEDEEARGVARIVLDVTKVLPGASRVTRDGGRQRRTLAIV